MEFETLLHVQKLDEKFVYEVGNLLVRKRGNEELNTENKIGIINNFLEDKIGYFERYVKTLKVEKPKKNEVLDILLRDTIRDSGKFFR